MTTSSTVLIVGASFSGLAAAACLRRLKIPYSIIEKESTVGAPWRHHYDRLHLHTNKRLSGLPYYGWDAGAPRYPSRLQVIAYIEAYQRAFDIQPHFQTEAISIRRLDNRWITETNSRTFESRFVVMATGAYGRPETVELAGQESFPGRVLHSYEYKTAADFRGRRVLVVGFGNSACEIAIDLVEQGAAASMAVRSAVNVIPRDILGVPVVELSLILSYLPPRLADRIAGPLVRGVIGDVARLGLQRLPYGPIEQIVKDGKAPVLDIGVVKLIRQGKIRIYPGVERIEAETVRFANGHAANFDAIVTAIGYTRNSAEIVDVARNRFEDLRLQIDRQRHFGEDGLYFCGYWVSPTGQIREIARDAKKIAADIDKLLLTSDR
jgi:indole-3-pyruvate monooxygenase